MNNGLPVWHFLLLYGVCPRRQRLSDPLNCRRPSFDYNNERNCFQNELHIIITAGPDELVRFTIVISSTSPSEHQSSTNTSQAVAATALQFQLGNRSHRTFVRTYDKNKAQPMRETFAHSILLWPQPVWKSFGASISHHHRWITLRTVLDPR